MARSRHPNKEIEAAIQYAESQGWRVIQKKGGHNWGQMYCPHSARDGCLRGIHSTPKNPQLHVLKLMQAVVKCPHQ